MAERIPVYYTFGNHMHWVDMQWLWGYHVMPGSVRDMIKFCRETGAKGCVNFDGIGYEKMASEAPEALAELRQAVQEGWIEPVGCSYGQPYGLFHGGESNIRQRVYGVRSVMRLLGIRPRTFWEEEFDFFPQLPQMLRGVGFTGSSLYFQWTWHTPEVPFEAAPVVWWEGIDGSRLLCATRNRLNLHQWPEDFQILLNDLAEFGPEETLRRGALTPPPTPSPCPAQTSGDREGAPESDEPDESDKSDPSDMSDTSAPLILQWLELMPSPDWMCRSELMVPKLKELLADERFEVKFATLGQYLALSAPSPSSGHEHKVGAGHKDLPVRRYSLDDVWHGMSLGKNGDAHPCHSAALEHDLLLAETASAVLGLFGRPYEPWDVYPVWEYEECWRNLLAAQHHDNHECEGLCGHVAIAQMAYVENALRGLDPVEKLACRIQTDLTADLVFNGAGTCLPRDPQAESSKQVPAMGYCLVPCEQPSSLNDWVVKGEIAIFESKNITVEVCLKTGRLKRLRSREHDLDLGDSESPKFEWKEDGKSHVSETRYEFPTDVENGTLFVMTGTPWDIGIWYRPLEDTGILEVTVSVDHGRTIDGPTPWNLDPGLGGAVKSIWKWPFPVARIAADSPYSVQEVKTGSRGRRKYPEGDWMTSPQWFESVEGAFTSQSLVDFESATGDGLLVCHSGAQQWLAQDGAWANVLVSKDPWDGRHFDLERKVVYWLIPHGPHSNSECVRLATAVKGMAEGSSGTWPFETCKVGPFEGQGVAPIPDQFSAVQLAPSNVIATALYREAEDYSGRDLDSYAGRGMGYPYVLRLVEFDGLESDVELTIAGPVAKAFKTNLLGEIEEELKPERGNDTKLTPTPEQLKPFGIEAALIKFKMRPYEIATLYLDIVPGRKQFRDLDAKREVWATVHRKGEE